MSVHNLVLLPLFALFACSSDASAESPQEAAAVDVPAEIAADDQGPVEASTGEGSTLSIKLTNFRSADGQVLVALFRGGDGFPSKPGNAYRTAVTKISGSSASVEFKDLPAGEYAFSVIHDENGNNELDTNFIGIPKEGLGTSNNAKARMGPPKYRDAKFAVGDAPVTQRVKIVYL